MSAGSSVAFGDRIAGGVYGALVGDALGVPVEFSGRSTRDADPVAEMRAGGVWRQPAGTWSDDGALLLCTVEGLTQDYSPENLGRLFVAWMKARHWTARDEVFDIGGATHTALGRIAEGVAAESAGVTGETENGNGSLMRILPVALRFGLTLTDAELARRAMEVSRITHAHPRSQLACAIYCLIAAGLLRQKTPAEAYRHAREEIGRQFHEFPSERAAFSRILSGEIPFLARAEIKSSGYVIDTLEASLWCLLRHETFESAVLAAVNLGGDTDTTGCVTGGLAGLVNGHAAVPAPWLEALPRREDLKALLSRFIPACGNSSP